MKNTELKVGMSFRVFEVSNKTCYNDDRLSGRWFCENLDNQLRYIAVRLFGWIVWNKRK